MLLIIDWNKPIIALNLNGLEDVLLYTSLTLNIVGIGIFLFQLRQIAQIKKDYAKLKETIKEIRTNGLVNQQNISRLFRLNEPEADSVESLREQVALINELLGTVMGASDLIAGDFDSPAERVEEARDRIKWERERRRLNKPNESDFYKG
jgi:hypothetical protein